MTYTHLKDHIPHTRELGSGTVCIVAGIHIANALSHSFFSKEQLVQMAAQLEGHPDNTTSAILGGMTIGAMNDKDMKKILNQAKVCGKKGTF